MFKARDKKVDEALAMAGHLDQEIARKGMHLFAKAVEQPMRDSFAQAVTTPLRKGIMPCDNLGNIFEPVDMRSARCVEFPLDLLKPGTEGDHTAYVIPNCGYIPQCTVEGDFVTVPTYMIGNCIDWCLKYQRDANYNVVDRAIEVYRDGFVVKKNNDGWHTILAAGLDRNIVVFDSAASAGAFTKRLVSLMKLVMRRNGGGNSTCQNRGKLTDLYISPEAMEDIRNWNIDQVDEITRREIFTNDDGADCELGLSRIFCVNLHIIDELGANQEYQLFYTNELGGVMPSGRKELVVGLDLSKNDSFVMPVREEMQMFEDMALHRQMRAGVYGWMELGFAILDGRRVLLGSI